ncbi:NAD(P)-binding domain-containing protein [Pseudonocardia sp. DSM 110487]|uniref:NAD(P)-binding domain-containing protein n=1 Tax=Pseudonocardia sp. DSM 110487 TaxID=2865833 RepID=UPI001C69CC62|nr:NAD(P)-binding domain-containing protein [Pseudonocardia sp. DSM 110487]QYN38719.1 NAD(P)-binding domain-containing protein [Pseudonocardia sp. DSM 110487]
MRYTTTVVIGAGHCGLAMSRCLAERSVDHVVLERGEVAHSWRTQRWDSLRLLTPNWMTRLPGFSYRGDDPDGYLGAPEVARLIEAYAAVSAAPVQTGTAVTSVRPDGCGYLLRTDQGDWHARTVVVATGAASVATVPAQLAAQVPVGVTTVTSAEYRNPGLLPGGAVLVVGASASGIQIAEELQRSGRPVTLAVGEHVRMPRTYRGRDILWWMDASGLLDERYDEVPDLLRARNLPSMQLVGSPQRATVDLDALRRLGVRLVGRLAAVRDGTAQFSGSLPNMCALADLKLGRLLDTIDAWAGKAGADADRPERFAPTEVPAPIPLSVRLAADEIGTIVWATGFRPDLSWLDVPVFDRKGRVVHDGGVTTAPGLYMMGLPFLRRRKSTLIDGAATDAHELAAHLVGHLDAVARRRAG